MVPPESSDLLRHRPVNGVPETDGGTVDFKTGASIRALEALLDPLKFGVFKRLAVE